MEVYAVAQASPRDKPKLLVHVLDKPKRLSAASSARRRSCSPLAPPPRSLPRSAAGWALATDLLLRLHPGSTPCLPSLLSSYPSPLLLFLLFSRDSSPPRAQPLSPLPARRGQDAPRAHAASISPDPLNPNYSAQVGQSLYLITECLLLISSRHSISNY